MKKLTLMLTLLVSVITTTTNAQNALDCSLQNTALSTMPVDIAVITMLDQGCFSDKCDSQMCEDIRGLKVITDQTKKVKTGAILTRELIAKVNNLPSSETWLIDYKKSFTTPTSAFVEGGFAEIEAAVMAVHGLTLFENNLDPQAPIKKLDLDPILEQSCPSPASFTSNECQKSFSLVTKVLSLQNLQNSIFVELLAQNRAATQGYLSALDKRWDTYASHANTLYPWERFINAKIFEGHTKKHTGFIEPPTTQFLFFHPTATLEIDPTPDKNFEEALTMELVGVHRWSTKSKYRQFGASIIASYNQSNSDVGYGVMLRLPNNWSIGVVERDGERSTVISLDLAQFFTSNKTARSTFEKFIK
jgi:hypothetical protein